jgi:hypothetical protein
MVALDVPKLTADDEICWVRVIVNAGQVVVCKDEEIRRKVEAKGPICGVSHADPDRDRALGLACSRFLAARIVYSPP